MLALDADIQVQGPGGTRRIASSAFFQDLFTVDLQPDEIIVSVRFTPVRPGRLTFFCDKKLLFFKSHREKGMTGTIEVREASPEESRVP